MRRRSGFTLIELICVVAIIAIIAGLAATRLDYLLPKYRLRGAAREVAGVLKLAKAHASGTGKDVYVEFDVSKGEYWMLVASLKLNDDGTPKDPPELEYQQVYRRALPRGITPGGGGVDFVDVITGDGTQKVTSGYARLRVSPFGLSNHVIVNLKLEDAPLAVRMNGITGELTFHEAYKDADELIEDTGE